MYFIGVFIILFQLLQLSDTIDVVTLVAGTGTSSITGDSSSATSAGIGYPATIALDSSNNIYIKQNDITILRT
jgi:hypothetical protein